VRAKLKLVLAALVLALTLVATAGATGRAQQASNTLIFSSSADPILLDPAFISDGESLRITDQIFNSLVGFKLGGSAIVPELATSWKASPNGKTWTFRLRHGVRFSDGTRFNAAAVCVNFNRWYNLPGPLQNINVSYYWQTVFLGFHHPAAGSPGPSQSLYRGCTTKGKYSVTIHLSHASSSVISALGLPNFGIASPTALKKYKANAGTVDTTGVFHPTGTFATQHPVGTGPWMLKSWTPGVKLVLVPNPHYWGKDKPKLKEVVYRTIADNAARLQALESGEVNAIDQVDPADFGTVKSNASLKLVKRPTSAVGYVGMNQSMPPMNNLLVRQAVAYGLDRASLVSAFYGGAAQLANQFLPPTLVGFAKSGVPSYSYNPEKAKALLQQAGLKLPVSVTLAYPSSVSRGYMPDPQRNAQAFAASLDKSGFSVNLVTAPWRPDYLGNATNGKYQLFLLGWIADYFDPQDFLNVHFGSAIPEFGLNDPKLFAALAKADAEPDLAKRAKMYQQASIEVMKTLPVVPYVWASGGTLAMQKNVLGYVPGPIGPVNEPWSLVYFGGGQ
jgi:peptide/nickel transport system substrate-binding protein